jgi:hypothetical protein
MSRNLVVFVLAEIRSGSSPQRDRMIQKWQ